MSHVDPWVLGLTDCCPPYCYISFTLWQSSWAVLIYLSLEMSTLSPPTLIRFNNLKTLVGSMFDLGFHDDFLEVLFVFLGEVAE